MQWRYQFKAQAHNFGLAQADERGDDLDGSLFRASLDHAVERFIIRRTAIGIAGTVLLNSANEDLLRSQHFGPAYGDGQEVRAANGHIGDRDLVPRGVTGGGCGPRDAFISDRRTTHSPHSIIAAYELIGDVYALANR